MVAVMFAVIFTASSLPSQAYYYEGGNWGGQDLLLSDGDSLSGSFDNIGTFYIPFGAIITGRTDDLVVNANNVAIDGSLNGVSDPGYDLKLYSQTNLALNGSLSFWKNITLSANTITLTGSSQISTLYSSATANYLPGSSAVLTIGATAPLTDPRIIPVTLGTGETVLLTGGSLLTLPTPIPAAAYLLGSGLLGLAGIRRRQQ